MNVTTHMQRGALALAAVVCMGVPPVCAIAQAVPQRNAGTSQPAPAAQYPAAQYPATHTDTHAGENASAAPQQVAFATAAPVGVSSSAVETMQDAPQAPQTAAATPAYAPAGSHSYWHTHGFDLAGLATARLQQNLDAQGPTTVGQSFDMGFLANIRENPVPWAGIELDYSYHQYTEHYRFPPTQTFVGYQPIQQHEATAGYVLHIKTPWVQPFVVLGGGGVYFRSGRVQPQYGGAYIGNGDQWRGAYMANVGFDLTSKRAKNFGLRIEEHSLFYKAPDFYQASLRSNAYVHQAMPAMGFFYRF